MHPMGMMKMGGMALVITRGVEAEEEAAITVDLEGEVIVTDLMWILHKMHTIKKHQSKDEVPLHS